MNSLILITGFFFPLQEKNNASTKNNGTELEVIKRMNVIQMKRIVLKRSSSATYPGKREIKREREREREKQ